jgi:hypothetical protein
MILNSESPAAGALQALLAVSPGLLQVLGEALLFYRKPLAAATSTGELPTYVHIILHNPFWSIIMFST